jgi:hypothetical protein
MPTSSTFLKLSGKETLLDEWEVLDDPADLQLADVLSVLAGLAFFIVPGLIEIWNILTRPRSLGHLCLTNWRLLYYQRGEGWLRNYHYVFTFDLEDIVALYSYYEEGLFERKTLVIRIYTRFEGQFVIRIGDTGGLMGMLPVIGRLFRRRTLGRDAFVALPVLFARIRQRQGAVAETSSAF